MKNHFFYPYVGNKREEVEHIYNLLDLNNINTIVEPFCGSCAVSYYIWSQNKDKNSKYILNDLDSNLINLLKSIRNCEYKDIENEVNKIREEILEYQNNMIETKTIYLKHVKSGKLSGYILHQCDISVQGKILESTQAYVNICKHFQMISEMSENDLKTLGHSVGFSPVLDNPRAARYNPTQAGANGHSGNGFCNNRPFAGASEYQISAQEAATINTIANTALQHKLSR